MNRIPQEMLDEVIEHQGETRAGQLSTYAVWQMALDLKETRALKSARPLVRRPPWEDVAQPTGYVMCTCGCVLQSQQQCREHWQLGHYDTVQP